MFLGLHHPDSRHEAEGEDCHGRPRLPRRLLPAPRPRPQPHPNSPTPGAPWLSPGCRPRQS